MAATRKISRYSWSSAPRTQFSYAVSLSARLPGPAVRVSQCRATRICCRRASPNAVRAARPTTMPTLRDSTTRLLASPCSVAAARSSTASESGAITSPNPTPHSSSSPDARRPAALSSSMPQPDISRNAPAATARPAADVARCPSQPASTPPASAPSGMPSRNRVSRRPECSVSSWYTPRASMGTSTRATISAPPTRRFALSEPPKARLRSRSRPTRGWRCRDSRHTNATSSAAAARPNGSA